MRCWWVGGDCVSVPSTGVCGHGAGLVLQAADVAAVGRGQPVALDQVANDYRGGAWKGVEKVAI